MAEKLGERGGFKIWRNPSARWECVTYLGDYYPPRGHHFFTAEDLKDLGFTPGQYTIRVPEGTALTRLISKWQTVKVPE